MNPVLTHSYPDLLLLDEHARADYIAGMPADYNYENDVHGGQTLTARGGVEHYDSIVRRPLFEVSLDTPWFRRHIGEPRRDITPCWCAGPGHHGADGYHWWPDQIVPLRFDEPLSEWPVLAVAGA